MDKTLHLLQKSVDGVPTGISLDMSLNVDGAGDFAEQRIVALSDKIPLVKPYFKKKQRKLDAKCLQQALEEPILSTLLRSDGLVSGDGVFVPRGRPGRSPAGLCAAAVTKQSRLGQESAKQSRAGDAELAAASADLEESRQRAEPKAGRPVPDRSAAAGRAPALASGDGNTQLLTSAAESLPAKEGVREDRRGLARQPDKGVLFEDKSEEASLDLVFELLTQLQYHTHQSDAVDICVEFLQGRCVYGNDCAHHHTVLPYHWQIRRSSAQTWHSIADESQEQMERLFCNPDNEHTTLKFQ